MRRSWRVSSSCTDRLSVTDGPNSIQRDNQKAAAHCNIVLCSCFRDAPNSQTKSSKPRTFVECQRQERHRGEESREDTLKICSPSANPYSRLRSLVLAGGTCCSPPAATKGRTWPPERTPRLGPGLPFRAVEWLSSLVRTRKKRPICWGA